MKKFAYSIEEALSLLPISRPTLYRLAAKGVLTIRKAGRKSFISAEDIQAFVSGAPTYKEAMQSKKKAAGT